MKYHVITNTYGPGGRSGALVQEWDLEDVKQPHRGIFEHMETQGFYVWLEGDLVYLIGVKV